MLDERPVAVVEKPTCCVRVKRAARSVYSLTASHLGLAAIMAVYTFGGALVFSRIEGPHETRKRLAVTAAREHIAETAGNVSGALWVTNETTFSETLRAQLEAYEVTVRESYEGGVGVSTDEVVWDYWGAMFFCVTTYSTIGKTVNTHDDR